MARLFSIHYSTIEGNRLTQDQVSRVIEKQELLPGRERDEKEVLGYYATLDKAEQAPTETWAGCRAAAEGGSLAPRWLIRGREAYGNSAGTPPSGRSPIRAARALVVTAARRYGVLRSKKDHVDDATSDRGRPRGIREDRARRSALLRHDRPAGQQEIPRQP